MNAIPLIAQVLGSTPVPFTPRISVRRRSLHYCTPFSLLPPHSLSKCPAPSLRGPLFPRHRLYMVLFELFSTSALGFKNFSFISHVFPFVKGTCTTKTMKCTNGYRALWAPTGAVAGVPTAASATTATTVHAAAGDAAAATPTDAAVAIAPDAALLYPLLPVQPPPLRLLLMTPPPPLPLHLLMLLLLPWPDSGMS